MKWQRIGAFSLLTIAIFLSRSYGQQATSTQGEAVLVALSEPAFPPLARMANVEGTVAVSVTVRLDGTTEASLVSGHPLLKEAALDSAEQSHFECRSCTAPVYIPSFTSSNARLKVVAARRTQVRSRSSRNRNLRTNKVAQKLSLLFRPKEYVFATPATVSKNPVHEVSLSLEVLDS